MCAEATEKNKKSVRGGYREKIKKVCGEEDTEKNKKSGERSELIMQVCYKDIVYLEYTSTTDEIKV